VAVSSKLHLDWGWFAHLIIRVGVELSNVADYIWPVHVDVDAARLIHALVFLSVEESLVVFEVLSLHSILHLLEFVSTLFAV
jgi:hypothetical protein